MPEEPHQLILDSMHRFDARQARFEDGLRDMSARLVSIESYLATMHQDSARHSGETPNVAQMRRFRRAFTRRPSGANLLSSSRHEATP